MKNVLEYIKAIPKSVCIGLIKAYQMVISPVLPASCRFIPTCSEYCVVAFKRFGFLKGFYLSIRRVVRCRPGGGYGYDPVPETWGHQN